MRIALWLRVSTEEQSTDSQAVALIAWAARRGWEIVRTFAVTESAYQGKHLAALSQVYEAAARREFEILGVFALDRLSRQGIGATFEIVDRLGRLGVSVASCSEPWLETGDGAMRELLLALSGWIAKQESARRSERTRAGLAKAISQGKRLGRPAGAKDKRPRQTNGYHLRAKRIRDTGRLNRAKQ